MRSAPLELVTAPGVAPTSVSFLRARKIARQSAGLYSRRCWWVEFAEVENVAWSSLLRAASSGNYRGPDPFQYLGMAATYGVQRFVQKNNTVLTAPPNMVCRHRVKMYVDEPVPDEERPDEIAPVRWIAKYDAEPELQARDWRRRVRDVVVQVVEDDTNAEVGLRVILGDGRPSELAREYGIDVVTIYRTVDRMKRRLSRSHALYQLAQEMG